uniref:Uncharacterized protein n=1 Tax=Rhizophora mucronata TaxID=61149 RepID=A0A2P2K5F1_RHIMU
MHRPAPGGRVRSAHADTNIISGTSTLISLLSLFGTSPGLLDRLWGTCFCSDILAC